ncbi:uncharacterized protein J3R85_004288 [Psidium guajava]|nr:uncharacterized protein J3R85_004288 [Psidium guajava]
MGLHDPGCGLQIVGNETPNGKLGSSYFGLQIAVKPSSNNSKFRGGTARIRGTEQQWQH